jgi:hypothetical protein
MAKGRREVQFGERHGNFVSHCNNRIIINILRNMTNLSGGPYLQSVNETGSRGVQKAYLAASERFRERTALEESI